MFILENWWLCLIILTAIYIISIKIEPLITRKIKGGEVSKEELEIMLIDLKNVLLSLMLQTEQYWQDNQGFKAGVLKKGEVIRQFLLQCSPFLKYFNLAFVSDLIDKLCNNELEEIIKKLKV